MLIEFYVHGVTFYHSIEHSLLHECEAIAIIFAKRKWRVNSECKTLPNIVVTSLTIECTHIMFLSQYNVHRNIYSVHCMQNDEMINQVPHVRNPN